MASSAEDMQQQQASLLESPLLEMEAAPSSSARDEDTDAFALTNLVESLASGAAVTLSIEDDEHDVTTLENRLVHSSTTTTITSSRYYCHALTERIHQSLAFAPTTPWLCTIGIPLIALLTHLLFIYGQVAPMWRLVLSADVDVWFNATSLETQAAYRALGLDLNYHVQAAHDVDVRMFTFSFAINELWQAEGMPSTTLPRIAAVLLVIFSGVWPHLKLFLLNLTWFFSAHAPQRKRMLHWLSTLGKWSLADVLVVCIMVGVLNLDWTVSPTAIKQGFADQLPLLFTLAQHQYSAADICSYFLKTDCNAASVFHVQCKTCNTFVRGILSHPETAQKTAQHLAQGVTESGSGFTTLRVQGMMGIYAFCLAVVISIALSLAVDVVDACAKHREDELEALLQADNENTLSLTTEYHGLPDSDMETGESSEETTTSGLTIMTTIDSLHEPQRSTLQQRFLQKKVLVSLASLTAGIVLAAILLDSLDRQVSGAIPKLVSDILGIEWNRSFSLLTLAQETGAAGGWDALLMGTFTLFLVVGPALRALLCILAVSLPKTASTTSSRLSWIQFLTAIDFLGAFCAWEVLVLATYLVSLLMPVTTDTIVTRPECAVVQEDGSCISVAFDPRSSFYLVMLGGVMLVGVAKIPWIMASIKKR